jgi:hypothetical protein
MVERASPGYTPATWATTCDFLPGAFSSSLKGRPASCAILAASDEGGSAIERRGGALFSRKVSIILAIIALVSAVLLVISLFFTVGK